MAARRAGAREERGAAQEGRAVGSIFDGCQMGRVFRSSAICSVKSGGTGRSVPSAPTGT